MRLVRAAALVAALCALSGFAAADTLIVKKVHSDGLPSMGQPAQDATQTTWIGADRMRMDTGTSALLVRLDQKKLYVLNGDAKKAFVVDLPIDFKKLVTAEQAPILEQMQGMKLKVTVTPSEEKKKILTFDARRYDVLIENPMGVRTEIKIWATKDVKVDLATLRALLEPLQGLSPMTPDLAAEMKKIDGVQLASETVSTVMGNTTKMTEELVSLEQQKAAPAGTYDIPAGYAVEPFNLMTSMTPKM